LDIKTSNIIAEKVVAIGIEACRQWQHCGKKKKTDKKKETTQDIFHNHLL
jgi:hypothetical protein